MRNNFNNEVKVPINKAISLLNNLVKIPSIKGTKNDGIIYFLEKELEELECHPEIFIADSNKFLDYIEHCPDVIGTEKKQKYISGIIKGSGGGKSILIYTHVDTMSVGNRDLWFTDPFKLVKKGDRLHGLGSADAKSAVAACVMALKAIKDMGIKLKGDVKFIASNEKDYGATGPMAVFTKGCNVDGALYIHAPETTHRIGEVKVRAHGILTFRITVFGEKPPLSEEGYNPTSYVSIKNGINAIDKSVKIIEALNEYAKKRDQKFNKEKENTIFNIGVIKGGEAPGVVADRCIIEGNIVFHTRETVTSIFEEIENILQRAIEEDKSLKKYPPKLEMIGKRANPGSLEFVGKGEAILETLKESLEEEGDCNFQILPKHPGSAIRFPMIFEQTPTVAFGPAAGNFSQPNEWVSQEEYIKTIRVLANSIIKWCK